MMAYRLIFYTLFMVFLTPNSAVAQYYAGSSMEIISNSNTLAKNCFYAATIAARIHYTSRKEIENCTAALNFTSLSLRDRAATLANRGIIYMALEEYQKAIQDYSSAMKLRPDFGELYVNTGNVYYMGQIYDKAIQEYTTAIDKKTSKIQIAHFNRGMAYESMGDLVNAEKDYKTAMDISPEWSLPQIKLTELRNKKPQS